VTEASTGPTTRREAARARTEADARRRARRAIPPRPGGGGEEGERTLVGGSLLLVTALLALAWVAADQPGLPGHFANDEGTIISVNRGTFAEADSSFQLIAAVYRGLGLAELPALAAIVGVTSYLVVLAVAISPGRLATAAWLDWVIIGSCIALAAIYHGAYTKDLLTVIVVLAFIVNRGRRLLAELIPVIAMLLYADAFRTYWFLVAGLYVALRLSLGMRRGWTATLTTILALYAALSVAFPAIVDVDLDHFRLTVNEYRSADSVNTLIVQFIPGSGPVWGFVNSVLTFASFILPLPLMLRGGAIYLAVAVILITVWGSLVGAIRSARRRAPRGSPTLTAFQNRLFAAILAFLIVQSIFEPDYGSFLRHLTPMLIMAVCLLLSLRSGAAAATREAATAPARAPAQRGPRWIDAAATRTSAATRAQENRPAAAAVPAAERAR
jgi:large-conductance mechanosensitive channel